MLIYQYGGESMKTKTLFDSDLTVDEAKELIKNGADVNIKNPYGGCSLKFPKNRLGAS